MVSFAGPETPFKIHVSDDKLSLLHRELELTTFPDELEGAGWAYGSPLADIKRLVVRWKDGYDWRKHEAQLNELPQFKRKILVDGFSDLDIHYIHAKSEVSGAIPLLFVHGWPGSFLEVKKVLRLLIKPDDPAAQPAFHVVAFSLPGYGFSSAPKKRGFGTEQYAEVGHKLMLSLGYEEYVVQGGDWGARIAQRLALRYGHKHVKAWHTNFPYTTELGNIPGGSFQNLDATTEEQKAAKDRSLWFNIEGRGYGVLHATQPQTPGYALADSPVGLLAWIYEKLVNWTDSYTWEDDEVLTWISIYQFSEAGPAASLRIYYERMHEKPVLEKPTIPLGMSFFPKELIIYLNSWFNDPSVVLMEEHSEGGHFAAYKAPLALVTDLRKMFAKGVPVFALGNQVL